MQSMVLQYNIPCARNSENQASTSFCYADISTHSITRFLEMAVPNEHNNIHIQKAQVKCVQEHRKLRVFIRTAEITLFLPSFHSDSFLC